MSAARRNSRKLDDLAEFPTPQESTPTETPSTVYLKTLMEIKEDLGGIKSDIKKLKDDVEEVKGKQSDIDKTISSIKTIFKTVVSILSLLALVRYWPTILSILQQ